jgi:hypothetical protein
MAWKIAGSPRMIRTLGGNGGKPGWSSLSEWGLGTVAVTRGMVCEFGWPTLREGMNLLNYYPSRRAFWFGASWVEVGKFEGLRPCDLEVRNFFMCTRGSFIALGLIAGCGLGLFAGTLVGPSTPAAFAAPEPDPVPRRWQLTVEPGPLRVAAVEHQGSQQMYYYMTYKVTNNTDTDLLFTPSFEMANDEGELVRSGRNVPGAVTAKILESLENPLILDQINIVGTLLQGEENAKEGIAIWPVGAAKVSSLEVFGNGFSGEARTIDAYDPATKGTKRVTLRKTMMLRFQPLGETKVTGAESLPMLEMRWIMR